MGLSSYITLLSSSESLLLAGIVAVQKQEPVMRKRKTILSKRELVKKVGTNSVTIAVMEDKTV